MPGLKCQDPGAAQAAGLLGGGAQGLRPDGLRCRSPLRVDGLTGAVVSSGSERAGTGFFWCPSLTARGEQEPVNRDCQHMEM